MRLRFNLRLLRSKRPPRQRVGNQRQTRRRQASTAALLAALFIAGAGASGTWAQDQTPPLPGPTAGPGEPLPVPQTVGVNPSAQDEEIAARLQNILQTTGWFVDPQVRVQNSVVFLTGRTETEDYRDWAGSLAANTQDVVAVVNQLEVTGRSPWDFSPAINAIQRFVRGLIQALPQIAFGLLILALTWGLARLVIAVARRWLSRSVQNSLLRELAAKLVGVPVIILGIYLVLQAFGLTRLALTVLGGTGLITLVIGIAFSDIIENFLASVLISVRKPFEAGDLIDVDDQNGIVQRVTTRSTVLMRLDGNYLQIPNATIYKSNIVNYTANPYRRVDFVVGIAYQDVIPAAQERVMSVLDEHPVVLQLPEPMVLVDSFDDEAVRLRVYFWIDGSKHDFFKAKSSVMRLTKRTLQDGNFHLPNPGQLAVTLQDGTAQPPARGETAPFRPPVSQALEPELIAAPAEGELGSEEEALQQQVRNSRIPEEGRNILGREAQ